MRYNICKFLLFIAVLSLSLFIGLPLVKAEIPLIIGYVINRYDNSGVPGVWVKWEDFQDKPVNERNVRYIQTGADGKFEFESWFTVDRGILLTTDIDTDLDGVNDSKQAKGYGFGCGEGPHNWSVVKPSGWNGKFTNILGQEAGFTDRFVNNIYSVPVPTIFYEPSCNCHSFDVDKIENLAPGKEATFITKAKVENPSTNKTEVINMEYKVLKNGVLVAPISGEQNRLVTATGPQYLTIGGKPVAIYTTTWKYKIPKEGSGIVTYNISAKINCRQRTTQLPARELSLLDNINIRFNVLNLISDYTNNLEIINIFKPQLVFSAGISPTPTPSVTPTRVPTVTIKPAIKITPAKSLKLGTFYPPEVKYACSEMWFKINYDLYYE